MEPEIIDWKNIESEFEEDGKYENFDAPKWFDLSSKDHGQLEDDQSWFCNSNCTHSKTTRDFANQRCTSKVKLLRSLSISEILPFGERSRSDVKTNDTFFSKQKSQVVKGLNSSRNVDGDDENKNPNTFPPIPFEKSKTTRKKDLCNFLENAPKSCEEPRLKSTFSARNLVAGREIMSHIAGLYSGVKRLAKKGPKKVASKSNLDGVLGELKQRVRDREIMPLLVRKE